MTLDDKTRKVHVLPMLIYKIFRQNEWDDLCREGFSLGAPVDLADGFIHFSTKAQLAETARKHFADQSDLMLVAVATEALGDALRWEISRGGAKFPHLYRRLEKQDVTWCHPFPLIEGVHQFPQEVI